jgi:hypothetical protein
MENAPPKFDWIDWLASIPGIPAGWGLAPIMATADSVVQMLATAAALPPLADEPERIAA